MCFGVAFVIGVTLLIVIINFKIKYIIHDIWQILSGYYKAVLEN